MLVLMSPEIIPIAGFSDPMSSISHLVGLSIFGLLGPVLIWRGRGSWSRMAWLMVLYLSTEMLLAMSMTYHMLEPGGFSREEVLRRLDHAAIFVLIAGTITTVHGILFSGWRRWLIILLLWMFVAAAVPLKMVFFHEMPEALGLGLYLGFGWVGLFSGFLLYRRYGFKFILLVLYGGLAYSIGAVAEFVDWPVVVPGVFGPHEFFHLAVLAGLALHWWFIWQFADGSVTRDQTQP